MTKDVHASPLESKDDSAFHAPPQALIRKELARAGIMAVRLIGPPGSGKTELIEATIKRVAEPCRVAVVVINPAAHRDAAQLRPHCKQVQFIDAAIPRAASVWRALQEIPLNDVDLILIEACGGLAPLEDLGQDATVAAFAVSGGDDKAAEYHALLKSASLVLLTQCDLRPMMKFNEEVFRGDVRTVNAAAEIFELSAINGAGMHHWLQWLETARFAKKRRNAPQDLEQSSSDTYFG